MMAVKMNMGGFIHRINMIIFLIQLTHAQNTALFVPKFILHHIQFSLLNTMVHPTGSG